MIMPHPKKTLIMKFGGASVRTPECFLKIAEIIIKRSLEYSRIVIVVSAMGEMTDELISLAKKVHPHPPRREYDMLVSAGERISTALLAMALSAKDKYAVSFTGSQSGIITTSHHSEARIIDVRPERLRSALDLGKFVIVAGFQGVSQDKEITTLGRGGSDTTAVALGVALGADKIEFYKDVQGIYETDPKMDPHAFLHRFLTHDQALSIVEKTGGQVLQPRSLKLALANALTLHVRPFENHDEEGTLISSNFTPLAGLQYEVT